MLVLGYEDWIKLSKLYIVYLQDGRIEGRVLNFFCENSKIATSCWTTINRRMLDPTKKK